MIGMLYAIAGVILFQFTEPLATKFLLRSDSSPPWAGSMLFLGCALMAWLGLLFRSASGEAVFEELLSDRQNKIDLFLAVSLGGILAPLLLSLPLTFAEIDAWVLLEGGRGFLVALIAVLIYGEKFSALSFFAMLLIFAGWILTLPSGNDIEFGPGALLILIAHICYALNANLFKQLAAYNPLEIIAVASSAVAATFLAVFYFTTGSAPPLIPAVLMLFVGAIFIFTATACMLLALRHLSAFHYAVFVLLGSPLTSAAYLVLNDLPPPAGIGLAVAAIGIGLAIAVFSIARDKRAA